MLASLGPVVIAAVVALLTTRLLSPGANTLYDVHLSEMLTAVDYFLIVGVGLLAGVCGPLLMWLMAASHRLFLRLKLSPPWQLALGGLIVGLLSLLTPKVWGNGYSVVQAFLQSPPLLSVIAGVFICKLLAVLASSGSARREACSRQPCLSVWQRECCLRRSLRCGFLALRRRSCSGWRVWRRCSPPQRMRQSCRP